MNQLIANQASSAFVQKYGPWAVVTGASDGIGRAMAREAAQRGLNVVLIARRQAELDRLANELAQAHGVLTCVRILGHVMGGMTRFL